MYAFPSNITLDEVKRILTRYPKFPIRVYDETETPGRGYVAFNYGAAIEGRFPHPHTAEDDATAREFAILRELRGLIFCGRTGQVISRRLHKFFNVDEQVECLLDDGVPAWSRVTAGDDGEPGKPPKVAGAPYAARPLTRSFIDPSTTSFEAYEKADGVLISPFYPPNPLEGTNPPLIWGTKAGATELCRYAEAIVARVPAYDALARHVEALGCTASFELCGPDTVIVVEGTNGSVDDKARLWLLAVRDRTTGVYWTHHEMQRLAQEKFPGVDVVPPVPTVKANDGETFAAFRRRIVDTVVDSEGVVAIIYPTGGNVVTAPMFVKIKTAWYLERYKLRDQVMLERFVWRACLDGTVDDVKPLVPTKVRAKLAAFNRALWDAVDTLANNIAALLQQHAASTPTEFAAALTTLKPTYGPLVKTVHLLRRDGLSSDVGKMREILVGNILNGKDSLLSSNRTLSSARAAFGGIVWTDRLFD
eukprot:PhM_4_TR17008/c0_g1_i1/m.42579